MAALAAGAMAILLASLFSPPMAAQAGIDARIEGSEGLGPGQRFEYTVVITGLEGDLNPLYRIEAWIEGADVTGGNPLKESPFLNLSREPRLLVNVTAPPREGEITLFVRASALLGEENLTVTQSRRIVVLQPWTIRVPIRNSGTVEVLNAVAHFYLNGRAIGNVTVPRIPANGEANATLNYVPVGVGPGTHQLRVDVDLNGDGRIQPELGERAIFQVVYKESPPPNPLFMILGVVAGAVIGVAVLVAMRRRR
jgi:hypothetical protein